MKCPYCNNEKLYQLQDQNYKCSQCKSKFSIKKINTDIQTIELFCNNINALEASRRLGVNYRTTKNRYDLFRKLIASYLDELYTNSVQDNSAYEEHYYFNVRQLQKRKKSLFDAINIIGFYSNRRVYTLLMPKLQKPSYHADESGFENYLNWHKLHSRDSYKTPLSIFWKYMEENLKKYKGINEKSFFYYLKECEFRFNFLQNRQIEILKNLYFNKNGRSS